MRGIRVKKKVESLEERVLDGVMDGRWRLTDLYLRTFIYFWQGLGLEAVDS